MRDDQRVEAGGLKVARPLLELVRDEMVPGTGIEAQAFWTALERIVHDLEPRNRALLDERDVLQQKLDRWHCERRGKPIDPATYRRFLLDIGYLAPEGDDFHISTENVDPEIAMVAGPQLVVPVDNARYALNAANARWGSLYDALYGTDVIDDAGGAERGEGYNPVRGERVFARAAQLLDDIAPLAGAEHARVIEYALEHRGGVAHLVATLADAKKAELEVASQLAGYRDTGAGVTSFLLYNNALHVELQVDREHPIGRAHPAGVKDIVMEAAITTIQDCEDSVSAADAEDKARVYRNWLGIMKGTLEAEFEKGGRRTARKLRPDRQFVDRSGGSFTLPGRSLLLVRNVGLHMYTDAVLARGEPIPEGFLDAMMTSLAAVHDLKGNSTVTNSRAGSVYIVKPKLHSPAEVAATVELFHRVEDALGLEPRTLKIGIMDEERRLTVNLKEAIRAAEDRVIFINTGFLDRTGDEIHTDMEAGPVLPKMEMKSTPWITAYEDWNVDIGIETGLPGKAQIGKGMWAIPDAMREMLETKIAHPQAGANTAWVPSPTAATLHAIHYHQVNVAERQAELASRGRASLDDILRLPLLGGRNLSEEEIARELENNAQGILGYVVRWVDHGVGCSKVPDIHDVALMEDRATLRISSQHIANWLHHGIVTERQVRETFERMAVVVDRQNAGDPTYRNMAPDFDHSVAFEAALDLVLKGVREPNGYTEPVLHARRRQVKAAAR